MASSLYLISPNETIAQEIGRVGKISHLTHLVDQINLIFTLLRGAAPLCISILDSKDWGPKGEEYTVKVGYTVQLNDAPHSPRSILWKYIWKGDGIPKVNIVCWTLAHGKVLIAENLRKRGISGPSRCLLCLSAQETSIDLFLECKFSI